MTGVKLVKINSIDVHLFLEKGMRGVSYIAKRYGKSDENTKMYPFSQILYKLLVNCIYGKSIECVHKRVNIKLINDKKHIKKLLTSHISYHKKYLIKILYLFIVLKKY